MSKLITLVQLLMASGPLTVSHPWPRRLLRRLSIALSLVMIGSILTGVLITTGLFWGYQEAIKQGYDPNIVLTVVVSSIVILLLATIVGFSVCIRDIKTQFKPFSGFQQPANLTTQVTNTVHSAVRGFTDGFMKGANTGTGSSSSSKG